MVLTVSELAEELNVFLLVQGIYYLDEYIRET